MEIDLRTASHSLRKEKCRKIFSHLKHTGMSIMLFRVIPLPRKEMRLELVKQNGEFNVLSIRKQITEKGGDRSGYRNP